MQRIRVILCGLVIFISTVALVQAMGPLAPSTALIPASNWRKDFKITAGKDQGRVVPLISQPNAGDGKRWRVIFGDYAAVHLLRDSGGTLLIERLDLIKSHNYVIYEPALPILPADLNSGGIFRRETNYKMFSLETNKLRRTGRITHVITRVSNSDFDTPAGPMKGYYIEVDHRMEMEYYSHLHLKLGLGCRLDEGPIFGAGQYTITKLGFFSETKTASAALAKR
jgi:hypothetical protein